MPVSRATVNSKKIHDFLIEFRKKTCKLIFLDESIRSALTRQAVLIYFETPSTPGYYFLNLGNKEKYYEIEKSKRTREKKGIEPTRLERYLVIVDHGTRFMQKMLLIIKEHIVCTRFDSYHDFLTRYKDDPKKEIKDRKVNRAFFLMKRYGELIRSYLAGDEIPLCIFIKIYSLYSGNITSDKYLEVLDCALEAYKKNKEIGEKYFGIEYEMLDKEEFFKEMPCPESKRGWWLRMWDSIRAYSKRLDSGNEQT